MATAEQLITGNLAIWTSALQTKSTAGRGKTNKLELYGIKKLRELILELAVRGLLVPQDTNDEPARVVLEKIKIEKTRLIKEGKTGSSFQFIVSRDGRSTKPWGSCLLVASARSNCRAGLIAASRHASKSVSKCI